MRSLRIVAISVLVVVMTTGCTQVSRQMGSLTANKYAEPRSGTNWVVAPPQLEPPRADERTVYISYRNISDADLDIRSLLRRAAQEQGWDVVNTPNGADYRLRASTRYFGEVEPESGGSKVGRQLGYVAGAATGLGVGAATADVTDSNLAGSAIGLSAGGLIAAGVSNASRPREWALIMDVVLEERLDESIEVEVRSSTGSASATASGTGSSRTSSGGVESRSNTSEATTTKETNYFPHGIRLAVWANQMNMSEEEAVPHIEERTERVVTQMLPR